MGAQIKLMGFTHATGMLPCVAQLDQLQVADFVI
jgi:hypothetical protein